MSGTTVDDVHNSASREPTETESGGGAGALAASVLDTASHLLRRPAVGASIAGGVVLAAGAAFGVTEALLAAAAAYAVFRSLKRGSATPTPA